MRIHQSQAQTDCAHAGVYTWIKTEPPTVICMIPCHQTINPSSELCDDRGLEVIISMSTFCLCLATERIIMGKDFGCHLSEKAWRQLSGPKTMCCYTLPSFFWSRQVSTGVRYLITVPLFVVVSLCILCPLCILCRA